MSTHNKSIDMTAALATPTGLGSNAIKDLSHGLNALVADMFALYVKTKNFHWHVSGPHFRDYHLLLDEQADQIFATIDAIAERVRKIGGTTLRSVGHIGRLQRIKDNDVDYLRAPDMLVELQADSLNLVAHMRELHDQCDQYRDVATASLIEVWIDEAERRTWFLFEAGRNDERLQIDMGRQKIAFAMSGPNRDASRKSSEIRVATERTSLELDRLLDAALEDTFPASDPISNLRGSFPADNQTKVKLLFRLARYQFLYPEALQSFAAIDFSMPPQLLWRHWRMGRRYETAPREFVRHPLAIELAAACAGAFGVEGLASIIDDRLSLLTDGRRTAPARRQTLRETFDWSYDLLSEPERAVMRRLAAFVGDFSMESAILAAGDGEMDPANIRDNE